MSLAEAARELDVSPATLRRWVGDGFVPLPEGEWTLARGGGGGGEMTEEAGA